MQPEAAYRGNGLKEPSDVLKWPLLRLDEHGAWERWFTLAGVAAPETLQGPVLNRASMVIDAAIDGQGIALARTTLAAWDLISGRIVRPFDVSWRLATTYWIVCPKATAKVTKIRRFRDWLLAEAADDTRRLEVSSSLP
jgi:LysR family glycine cleavage system transcriptional activator